MSICLPFAFPMLAKRTHLPGAEEIERTGIQGLLIGMAVSMSVGAVLLFIGRRGKGSALYQKEAMAIVGLSWVLATVLGAIPFYFGGVSLRVDDVGRPQRVTFVDAMFESQSGFSTTGATILTDLESQSLVPHCILFWRSWTHFLGGLGIMVLFVAILGQGSAGKAMMRAEMPGPTKEGSMPRMQKTALVFAGIYIGLNIALTLIYMTEGMTLFDALCHAFGTMATGGFSTYNRSLGGFDSALIEATTIVFMIIAGTNFTLMYLACLAGPKRFFAKLFGDIEFKTFVAIITLVTIAVIYFGMRAEDDGFDSASSSLRFGLFQVVSVLTTTGYGTADFDGWNNFGRGALLLLMFVGGCAGSTGGGMKVIRHILFYKILTQEIERAHRPRVVRLLRIGGSNIDDPNLARGIIVYFCMVLAIFVISWFLLVTLEPDSTWGQDQQDTASQQSADVAHDATELVDATEATGSNASKDLNETSTLDEKLLDSASAVAATLNNIGPGLGVVGATKNYANFSQGAKLLFVWLMMLGRVEIFSVLVLVYPSFWRRV